MEKIIKREKHTLLEWLRGLLLEDLLKARAMVSWLASSKSLCKFSCQQTQWKKFDVISMKRWTKLGAFLKTIKFDTYTNVGKKIMRLGDIWPQLDSCKDCSKMLKLQRNWLIRLVSKILQETKKCNEL